MSQGSLYVGSGGIFQTSATGSITCAGTASCGAGSYVLGNALTITTTGGGSGTVSTSTNETAGQLAYWTSNSATPALLGKVSTTTLAGGGPITVSNTPVVIGASGAVLGCTSASSGVTGCLTGTDWNIFNTKLSTDPNWNFLSGQNAIQPTTTTVGVEVTASSTIGDGTQAGGLTVNGGSTTTLNAYFANKIGIGVKAPNTLLTIQGATNASYIALQNGTTDWRISLGNDTVPSIYVGGSTLAQYFWRANWNTAGVAHNTFENPNTAAVDTLTVAELTQHNSTDTGDLLHVTSFGAQSGNVFNIASSSNTGVASSSPFARLSVHVGPTDTSRPTTLFAIGSSTVSATTTLFSVNNVGTITTQLGNALILSGGANTALSAYVPPSNCANQASQGISATGASFNCASINNAWWSGTQLSYANGGTNNTSAYTQGSVIFAGASALTQNNANFFWNNAATSLLLGTTTGQFSPLIVASSTAPQLTLSDSTAGVGSFSLRVENDGSFNLATSTFNATSSTPVLSIVPSTSANATTTFSITDWVLKQTSQTALVIKDAYNSIDAIFNTASTTGSIFTVAATTSPDLGANIVKLFDINQYGEIMASSTGPAAPVLTLCTQGGGSATLTAGSNDTVGSFTTGTLATSCTITFARAKQFTPAVFVEDNSTAATVDVSAQSTTAFTVTVSTGISGAKIYYMVVEGPSSL